MFLATLTDFNAIKVSFPHINCNNNDSIINEINTLNNVPVECAYEVIFKCCDLTEFLKK